MKYLQTYPLLLLLIFCVSCEGQDKVDLAHKENSPPAFKTVLTSEGPKHITRMVKQGSKGNIWIAAFDGVFRYDGASFTNITSGVSSSRFFSILEDRKGNWWFGSIGGGVYRYDPSADESGKGGFQHFTTKEGLVSNEIVSIYEDKIGHIWFGANGGLSSYDGKSFQNYKLSGNTLAEDNTWKFLPDLEKGARTVNEVNSIIEDKTGQFWFATRGNTYIYDGDVFASVTHDGKAFTNVRWIIEAENGHVWLGGQDGLWRYDGTTFSNITKNFVGYIHQDKNRNIWTSSQRTKDGKWVLSRYDAKSLSNQNPMVTEIESAYEYNKGMIFGISEANNGYIWFGALDGVYRYDGKTITGFKKKKSLE